MPFTLAHPTAVLPLKKLKPRWFSATGLIVGSMAPDYEYFLKQQPTPTLSETLWGVFLFDIPLALLVALVFHLLVKRPLIRSLPKPLDQRYSAYTHFSFLSYLGQHWGVFLSSLLLGIGSHLLLDWLTNPGNGPFANTALTETVQAGPIAETPLILLERLYDVAGTLALAAVVAGISKPLTSYRSSSTITKSIYWGVLLLSVAAIMLWEWRQAGGFDGFGIFVTTFLWALVGGLVIASVLIRFFDRQPLP